MITQTFHFIIIISYSWCDFVSFLLLAITPTPDNMNKLPTIHFKDRGSLKYKNPIKAFIYKKNFKLYGKHLKFLHLTDYL